MIHFIDLTGKIGNQSPAFAFYDSEAGKFLEFKGVQVWSDAWEFSQDFSGDDSKFMQLIPAHFIDDGEHSYRE